MSSSRPRDPESEVGPTIFRREFLVGSLVVLASPLAAHRALAFELPPETRGALSKSPFVYLSPLRSDGSESTCHGEVWYGWMEGAVHLMTSKTTWKAKSLGHGLDRARLWVGAYGQWKLGPLRNEDFRQGPHFDAKVEAVSDEALFRRLMGIYRRKYPEEIARWEPRFREGLVSGERLLLRYTPVSL